MVSPQNCLFMYKLEQDKQLFKFIPGLKHIITANTTLILGKPMQIYQILQNQTLLNNSNFRVQVQNLYIQKSKL